MFNIVCVTRHFAVTCRKHFVLFSHNKETIVYFYIILVQVEKSQLKVKWLVSFQIKMETLQVFIKTEKDEEEERDAARQFLPEETPCTEPIKSEG
jgi:hypothetical protein